MPYDTAVGHVGKACCQPGDVRPSTSAREAPNWRPLLCTKGRDRAIPRDPRLTIGVTMASQRERRAADRRPPAKRTETARPAGAGSTAGDLLDLQRLAGNRAVTGFVQRLTDARGPQEEDEDFGTLGQSRELPGSPGAVVDVQRKSSPGVTTEVTGSGDDVTTVQLPGDQIGTEHGRPGAVGWTTPRYNLSFAGSGPQAVHATTNMSFRMELAQEYAGARGQVLRDHEQGHTRIGMDRARRHFDEQLHDAIAALPRPFTVAAIRGVQDSVVADFVAGERADSQAYDHSDYPRMGRAYQGARQSMADIGRAAPGLQRLIDGLRHFTSAGPAEIGPSAEHVTAAIQACTAEQIQTVQYNPEFSGVARQAIDHGAALQAGSGVPDSARAGLDAAMGAMRDSLRFSSERAVAASRAPAHQ